MLFILNRRYEVVGTLNHKGDLSKIVPYFDDKYVRDLISGAETYTFSTRANTKQAQHLTVGNYIVFREKKEFKLFNIINIQEEHTEIFTKTVYCEMAGIGLTNDKVRPMELPRCDIKRFMNTILADTVWQLGKFDAGLTQVFDFELKEITSAYDLIQEYVVKKFGAEINYRVEFSNGTITGRYIDVYYERSSFKGKRFDYKTNMTSVSREVDISEIATAIIATGKNNITFKTIDTPDKPLNQDFLINQQAYKQWNIDGDHIFGTFKAETESPQELLKLTREESIKRGQPKVKYEVKVELLGDEVELGETCNIIDQEFNPPLYLTGRIGKLETSRTNPESNSCVLSNYKEVNSSITEEMRKIAEGYVSSQFPIGGDKIQDGAIDEKKVSRVFKTQIIADSVTASLVETQKLVANKADIESLKTVKAQIGELKSGVVIADKLETIEGNIQTLESSKISSQELNTNLAIVTHLISEKVSTKELETNIATIQNTITKNLTATNAEIELLRAEDAEINKIVTNNLNATNGKIDNLTSNVATITQLVSEKANIKDLEVTNANIGTLNAKFSVLDSAFVNNLSATSAEIEKLKTKDAEIDTLVANNFSATNGKFEKLDSDLGVINTAIINNAKIASAEIEKLKSKDANIENLVSEKASIKELTSMKTTVDVLNAKVGNLDSAIINNLSATSAEIEKLKTKNISIDNALIEKASIIELNVAKENVVTLNAKVANIDTTIAKNLTATSAEIEKLNTSKANISDLKVTNANIDLLKSNVTDVNHILAGNITSKNLSTNIITADSGIIANGAIGSAQISELDANKIKSGLIDTSLVKIQSSNGQLVLLNNKLQVFDNKDNSLYERIMLGVDVEGRSKLLLRSEDGKSILLDENGVTQLGFTDGFNKVDNNSLSASKFEKNSIIKQINGATETISGTHINVGDRTLDVELSTQKNTIEETKKELSTQKSTISALDSAIKLKVDNQTYTTDKVNLTSKIEKNTSTVEVLKNQIALKIEGSYVDKAINTNNEKINSSIAEIKVSTDKVEQNVNTLSTKVDTKADGSIVSALSSKIATLETSTNGIKGQVSTLEKTTTTLSADITKAQTDAKNANDKASSVQGEMTKTNSKVATLDINLQGITQRVSNTETTANNANNNALSATELAKAMSEGKMIFSDPNFRQGYNNVVAYNNTGNGNVVVTRIAKISDCPSTSTHFLEIKHTGVASPAFGGFYQTIQSRANAIFIQKFIAKLPVGYSLNTASNPMGSGYSDKWLTSNKGTDKWETYIREVRCGSTGSFSNGGHVYVSGSPEPSASNPLIWHIAFCTCYDLTDNDESINVLNNEISTVNSKVTEIKTSTEQINLSVKEINKVTTQQGDLIKKNESAINLQKDAIELKVDANDVINAIRLDSSGVKIQGNKIDLEGLVTISDLDTNTNEFGGLFAKEFKKTVIDGGRILTGSVKATTVDLRGLNIKELLDDGIERDSLKISSEGSIKLCGDISSFDYNPELKTGWSLSKDGNATLNNAIVRGSVILPNAGITNYSSGESNNILLNSDYSKTDINNLDWDKNLNGNMSATSWSDYNGGVSNPKTGYHAHINTSTFDFNVIELKAINNERWLGSSQYISPSVYQFKKDTTYYFSMDVYFTEVGQIVDGGLYYKINEVNGFHSGSYSFTAKQEDLNKWVRFSWSFKLKDDAQLDRGFTWYNYGNSGEVSTKSKYIKNCLLTETNTKVWCVNSSEENDVVRIWSGTDFKNRKNAPFRVMHNGDIYAENGTFKGTFAGKVEIGNIIIEDTVDSAGSIIFTGQDKKPVIHIDETSILLGRNTTIGDSNTNLSITETQIISTNKNVSITKTDKSGKTKSIINIDKDNKRFLTLNDTHTLIEEEDKLIIEGNMTKFSNDVTVGNNIITENLIVGSMQMKRKEDIGNKGIDFIFV